MIVLQEALLTAKMIVTSETIIELINVLPSGIENGEEQPLPPILGHNT